MLPAKAENFFVTSKTFPFVENLLTNPFSFSKVYSSVSLKRSFITSLEIPLSENSYSYLTH